MIRMCQICSIVALSENKISSGDSSSNNGVSKLGGLDRVDQRVKVTWLEEFEETTKTHYIYKGGTLT